MLTFVFFNSIKKEGEGGNVLFNDTYNTFYLWFCGVGRMVTTIQIAWEETHCCHDTSYCFGLAAWKSTKTPITRPKYKPKQKPHTQQNPQKKYLKNN